jgi:NSS family neurotransmitter:Na+ symporter
MTGTNLRIDLPQRESLGSRTGFLLLAAGCAIGLGNVWRFPFIAGKYGGAAFVVVYLVFLILLGLPIMVMEFSVGRASRQNAGKAFQTLAPSKRFWHLYGHAGIAANYLLMMFYTTVTGWILYYLFVSPGGICGPDTGRTGQIFTAMLQDPASMGVGWSLPLWRVFS